jgi:glutathione S-transferase
MAGSELTLVIGDKTYSSWSLRPWLVLKAFDIPFGEESITLRQADTRTRILSVSPAGRVPILKDGALTVWDSLAIAEHLAERFAEKPLWPEAAEARAHARSISAEMHSGFAALRTECPMNLAASMTGYVPTGAVARDVERIDALWQDARTRFGFGGAFLFGAFTIADAFYAPVAARFRTYGIALSDVSQRYCDAIFAVPAMQAWEAEARVEREGRTPNG